MIRAPLAGIERPSLSVLAGFSSNSGFIVSLHPRKVLGCPHNCRDRKRSPWVDGFGAGDLSRQRQQPYATPKLTSSAPSCRLDSALGPRPEHQNLILSTPSFGSYPWDCAGPWAPVAALRRFYLGPVCMQFSSCPLDSRSAERAVPPWAGTLCPTPHSP